MASKLGDILSKAGGNVSELLFKHLPIPAPGEVIDLGKAALVKLTLDPSFITSGNSGIFTVLTSLYNRYIAGKPDIQQKATRIIGTKSIGTIAKLVVGVGLSTLADQPLVLDVGKELLKGLPSELVPTQAEIYACLNEGPQIKGLPRGLPYITTGENWVALHSLGGQKCQDLLVSTGIEAEHFMNEEFKQITGSVEKLPTLYNPEFDAVDIHFGYLDCDSLNLTNVPASFVIIADTIASGKLQYNDTLAFTFDKAPYLVPVIVKALHDTLPKVLAVVEAVPETKNLLSKLKDLLKAIPIIVGKLKIDNSLE